MSVESRFNALIAVFVVMFLVFVGCLVSSADRDRRTDCAAKMHLARDLRDTLFVVDHWPECSTVPK